MTQINWICTLSTTFCAMCSFAAVIHPKAHGPSHYDALMFAIFWNCSALSAWPSVLDPQLRHYLALSAEERKRPGVHKPIGYWIMNAYVIAAFVLPALVFIWHFRHHQL